MSLTIDPKFGERYVKRPIILVGSPRSGTTLLGRLISAHPEVAYWEEPRTVWSTGNQNLPDDVLLEAHLTPEIATDIDQRFAEFLSQENKTRFAEKTPSNMLRLPFIHALYPDCKIIHLYRDPRPVITSALRMLNSPPDLNRITTRAREARLRDWPYLTGLFFRDAVMRLFRQSGKSFWGPKPPGWKTWKNLPPLEMLCEQWLSLINTARNDLNQLPDESWIEIRYEDLIDNPTATLETLLNFAKLEFSEAVFQMADQIIQSDRASNWQSKVRPEQLKVIENKTASMLEELNYPI